jgi:hypothetical protein
MTLIDIKHKYDFGHELIFSLLKGKTYSAFQLSLDWNDCGGWPYLQMSAGMGRAFSFLLSIGRFGISFDIIGYTWPDSHMVYDEDEETD